MFTELSIIVYVNDDAKHYSVKHTQALGLPLAEESDYFYKTVIIL